MKKILGLDVGTTSIGWALVHEDQKNRNNSKIIKLGVRVNPLSTTEKTDFEKGKSISLNAERTLKRGARRNLQRYKQRRSNLIQLLHKEGIINTKTALTETGKHTTFETLQLRAAAVQRKIALAEFARVLLMINKKRGYKSSRKAKNDEEGSLIDGMEVAKKMYDENLTPGQFALSLLKADKSTIPDFYRSDLQQEFDRIWAFQQPFYPTILTPEFYKKLKGQGKQSSSKLFLAIHQIYTADNKGKGAKLQHYTWRSAALTEKLPLEQVAYVLVEINNNLNKSSGYLGAISDRSKHLYFSKQTVGEYLHQQVAENPHQRLKNQVFYRQDYLDEFERIWETQAQFHKALTPELKTEVRDVIIFYQRKLKSQKHLISECLFEKHHKVIPKSSPLFQEFKVWQLINNLEFTNGIFTEKPNLEYKQQLFKELNVKEKLSASQLLKICGYAKKEWSVNYKEGIEGNKTNAALFTAYQEILGEEGYGDDWAKKSAEENTEKIHAVFEALGIDTQILHFDATLPGNAFDKQPAYLLWHLLYAFEDEKSSSAEDIIKYGTVNTRLQKQLHLKYGFKPSHCKWLVNISLKQDYGSLSAKAIKKIMPFLMQGYTYDEAAKKAGYNHSNSLTKEEQANRVLKDELDLVKNNSLRNPIVEKILNQMVNLVNQLIAHYGKPDEIRIELARELKKSAKERDAATKGINAAQKLHANYRKILKHDFGIKNPTRNDIIKYKLYLELKNNGFKTIYTNQYIAKKDLFSKEIDIEHIIPKARLFDDSFANKTLAFRKINQKKSDSTALDFITTNFPNELENYKNRINNLVKDKSISKTKANKLFMSENEIPLGFIERDLRDTQYIAKEAKRMLEEVVKNVHTTTGKITGKLRQDWDLVNVLQELTLPKFKAIDPNLIEEVEKKDGTFKTRIKNWSKRNDHRHHAMDALTVAFTKPSHVQYLNNLNAKSDKNSIIYAIREKETTLDKNGKRKFIPPLPNFRTEAKKQLSAVLISFKNKNKVVTLNKNKNKIKQKGKDRSEEEKQLSPRGQLHEATIYGKIKVNEKAKNEKVSAKFDAVKIQHVTQPIYREALLKRLKENNNDPKKAFTGKNALLKTPIYLTADKTKVVPEYVKVLSVEETFTIRKEITPDLKIDKVIDKGIRTILTNRLAAYENDPKTAFTNLDKNPIWLNKEKGITIKSVKIKGVKNAEPLHDKKNHFGNPIFDKDGKNQPVDFVSYGNNHHIAIYKDEKGKLQEDVVSFYKAVARVTCNEPIINKGLNKEKGWQFLFTLKKNEMFIFPTATFDPHTIDVLDEKNYAKISPHLYRVRKISSKNYCFMHHLETTVEEIKELKETTFINKRTLEEFDKLVKVRINHIGQIVAKGE